MGLLAIAFLLVHALLIPPAAWRTRQRLASLPVDPALRTHVLSLFVTQLVLTVMAWVVARVERLPIAAGAMGARQLLLALAVWTAAVTMMWPEWRRTSARRDRVLQLFAPRTAGERWLWVGLCVMAACGEELTYRGVIFGLLARTTGHWLAAALGAAVIFGLAHLAQGRRSALVIVSFGLGFQFLVLEAGGLGVAIAVHFGYDVVAGLVYGRLLGDAPTSPPVDVEDEGPRPASLDHSDRTAAPVELPDSAD